MAMQSGAVKLNLTFELGTLESLPLCLSSGGTTPLMWHSASASLISALSDVYMVIGCCASLDIISFKHLGIYALLVAQVSDARTLAPNIMPWRSWLKRLVI